MELHTFMDDQIMAKKVRPAVQKGILDVCEWELGTAENHESRINVVKMQSRAVWGVWGLD